MSSFLKTMRPRKLFLAASLLLAGMCVSVPAEATSIITTFAGNGDSSGPSGETGDGGLATSAYIYNPYGVATDSSGNVYITDRNGRIRKVNASDGVISTLTDAVSPWLGIVVDSTGNVYVADTWNQRIVMIDTTGALTVVAGTGTSGFSGDGGLATAAELSTPYGLILDNDGNIIIADTGNSRVRKVTVSTGVITTIAGGGTPSDGVGDGGLATDAQLINPQGLAVDSLGNIYVSDFNISMNRIRKINASDQTISTVVGTGTCSESSDGGLATATDICQPSGLAFDSNGILHFAEASTNHRVRKVNSDGTITTVAGTTQGFSGDGGDPLLAQLYYPSGLAFDGDGNLYIADAYNNRVRKVSPPVVLPNLLLVSAGSSTKLGGISTSGLVQLDSAAPVGGAVVDVSVTNLTSPGSPPPVTLTNGATITVPEGATQVSLPYTTSIVPVNTTVRFTGTYNGVTKTHDMTVLPPVLTNLTLSQSTIMGEGTLTGKVSLSSVAPAGGITVTLGSANAGASVPPTVTVPEGVNNASFTINTSWSATNQTGDISATFNGTTKTASLTVTTEPVFWLFLLPSYTVGEGKVAGYVMLRQPAPVSGVEISLSSDHSGASVPETVTVPAGAMGAYFSVQTYAVETNQTATITASGGGATKTASLSLQGVSLYTLHLIPSSIKGGGYSLGMVTLNAVAPAGGITVTLTNGNGAATVPTSVWVPEGSRGAVFLVTSTTVGTNTTGAVTATLNGATRTVNLTVRP